MPKLTNRCNTRWLQSSANHLNRFSVHQLAWLPFQEKKDFSLHLSNDGQSNRVYGRGFKNYSLPRSLFRKSAKFSKKIIVSVFLTWKGIFRPFLWVTVRFKSMESFMVPTQRFISLPQEDVLLQQFHLYPGQHPMAQT